MPRTIPPTIIVAAQKAQAEWGVPASVSLAQYAVESGWGEHLSAPHNPFGIKAKGDEPRANVMTREVIDGHEIRVRQPFRAFTSMAEAFDEHAKLLATAKCYGPAREKLPDVFAYCDALTGVYATDPRYGELLKGVIRGSANLRQYDV